MKPNGKEIMEYLIHLLDLQQGVKRTIELKEIERR